LDHTLIWLGLVVLLALVFDFSNGVHDAANAIATTVTTRALSLSNAVIMAAVLNFVGAVANTTVASFIGKGLVAPTMITLPVVTAALCGAIAWNLLTWYYGLPSSSSHSLIGGLFGSVLVGAGWHAIHLVGLTKTLVALVVSPLLGFAVAYLLMVCLLRTFASLPYTPLMRGFRKLQIASAAFMAYAHGSNDAQKTMGIVTLALIIAGYLPAKAPIPLWVISISAVAMAMGTAAGGWRIIKTMGSRLVDLSPAHGFSATTAAASVILLATRLGLPISTTHVIASAVLGVGATRRANSVRWGIAANIVMAWMFTIPGAGLVAGLIELALKHLPHG